MEQLLVREIESMLTKLQDQEVRNLQHLLHVKFEYDWYDNKYRVRQKDLKKLAKKKEIILQHLIISNNNESEMFMPETVQYVL